MKMRFEVIGGDGQVKMSTEYECCIYPREILLNMEAAGYTFRMDGKPWKPAKRKRKVIE
jgi:hypothetical protein